MCRPTPAARSTSSPCPATSWAICICKGTSRRSRTATTGTLASAAPADTVVSPSDPIFTLLEQRGLPKYPYDLSAAQRLLGDAGWTRGGDGIYRSATGEPFTIDLQTNSGPENIVEANAVAGQWRA